MTDTHAQTPTETFATALVDVGAQLATILHHLSTYPGPKTPEEPVDVLRRLLAETFEGELDCDSRALETAASVLSASATVIEEQLFLVEPTPPPKRSRGDDGRRRRRSRR
ncbi:MAG TPA: hypothetical protein VHY55_07185 [Acidimicrobiia bacterium]|nr:hypothetical protein [Acidimicrobiia bacterium]